MIYYSSDNEINSFKKLSKIIDMSDRKKLSPLVVGGAYPSLLTYSARYRGATGFSTGQKSKQLYFSAIGEALERRCFTSVKPHFYSLSYNEIVGKHFPVFDPESCKWYFENQKTYQNNEVFNLKRDQKTDWSWHEEATDKNKRVLLPFTFNSYSALKIPFFYMGSSSGNGCGQSLESARLAAVMELMERDALMFYWWTKTTPQRIDLSGMNDDFLKLFNESPDLSKKMKFFYLKTDLNSTVILATFRGNYKKGQPRFVIASSAHLNPAKALSKSFFELIQFLKNLHCENSPSPSYGKDYDRTILTFLDHGQLYAQFPMKNAYGFLFSKPSLKIKITDIKNCSASHSSKDLRKVVRDFKKNNYSLYFSDFTTRDLKFAGIYVARAFSPNLAQIDFIHRYRMLGCERYQKLSKKLKIRKRDISFSEFNKYPHPFS